MKRFLRSFITAAVVAGTVFIAVYRLMAPYIPPGSQAALCVGGDIGRYWSTPLQGHAVSLPIALPSVPTTFGSTPVLPGETRNFQYWYRDPDHLGTCGDVFNLTNALGF